MKSKRARIVEELARYYGYAMPLAVGAIEDLLRSEPVGEQGSITADAVSGQQENMMAAVIRPVEPNMTQEMRSAVGSEWAPNQATSSGVVEPVGEPVAWRYRFQHALGDWSLWRVTDSDPRDIVAFHVGCGRAVEYEPLFSLAAPPAAPEAQEPERGVDTWDVGSAILNDALRWRNGDATDAEFIARMLFLSAKEHARTTASLAEFDDVPTVSASSEEENDA